MGSTDVSPGAMILLEVLDLRKSFPKISRNVWCLQSCCSKLCAVLWALGISRSGLTIHEKVEKITIFSDIEIRELSALICRCPFSLVQYMTLSEVQRRVHC